VNPKGALAFSRVRTSFQKSCTPKTFNRKGRKENPQSSQRETGMSTLRTLRIFFATFADFLCHLRG
jgi:hypothetical protein